ncbi:MAG: hypothetical protein C4519_10370 [Desulfobacteraceae bacterium]|nr:MAG: hypothetical protein C4519_10370 [Desulfobacteraceae bacterium]
MLRTCVSPQGRFVYGLHRPSFSAANLRTQDTLLPLGRNAEGAVLLNTTNFPAGDVDEPGADPIFEIANPFPFRGTTYIGKPWADRAARDPGAIAIPCRAPMSLSQTLQSVFGGPADAGDRIERLFARLPRPVQLAVAAASSDADDLVRLAGSCCEFVRDPASGAPAGLVFAADACGRLKPKISDQALFDTVANNPFLPDAYKEVMVLRPGVQGQSEIVGEWRRNGSHVFEYLRRNSYIPWGHYAANMAHDAVRYAAGSLTAEDMRGMRHLYYQRTYLRLAESLDIKTPAGRSELSVDELELLRRSVLESLGGGKAAVFNATLWGWNYGFDYAPNGYRLHASHQQIHQQYALIPAAVPAVVAEGDKALPAFACGDMIHEFIQAYRRLTGRPFFECYQKAIAANRRMDGRSDRPSDLVVHQDEHLMLFVPKAQTSQWELQVMTRGPVGNLLEADAAVRAALDRALLLAMRILTAMGAAMISVIEYSKRFDIAGSDQRLLYVFLPRLPESPGAFSEAQLRWINGHYPEDFAQACRMKLPI